MTTDPTGTGLPGLAEVREHLGLPASVLSDEALERMWAAVIEVQVSVCRVPTDDVGDLIPEAWPASLVQALLRRIQRAAAAKNLPLGFLDLASEFGPARIPNWDAVIEELEASHRRVVVA